MTDDHIIKKDIIDNADADNTMKKVICSEIPHAKRIDISTGYFNVEGYGMLRNELELAASDKSFSMRLLLGRDAILPPEKTFEEQAERRAAQDATEVDADTPRPVKAGLDEAELDNKQQDDMAGLLGLLKRHNVQVKTATRRFNHSKCYIFGDSSVLIGSSNLTAGGLMGNYELNAGLYQPGVTEKTRAWFDRMWGDAEDAKDDLIRVLEESKFGTPPSPYDVYMKMLFETYKELLRPRDRQWQTEIQLAEFQRDAVDASMHIISRNRGGVIIADSTGLGKTNMGIEIMRQKMLMERKGIMLVAPKQVLDSVWRPELKDAGIPIRELVGMESMGREGFLDDLARYKKIKMVVIDESHNFRSKSAQRRKNLMKMLSVGPQKQVVLLTATPINNSLMDLYHQISIITKGRDDFFWETVKIADLEKHMRNAAKKDLQGGLDKIQELLDAVMVKRTRSFIREVYKTDRINNRGITFPAHEYRPIRYDLAKLYDGIYDRLYKGIGSLTMAPYAPERYNNGLTQEEKNKHAVLAHLQVVLLLKRFESSTEAVRISIDNKIRMYEHVERVLRQGRILRVKDFNAAFRRWSRREIDGEDVNDASDAEAEFVQMIEGIATDETGNKYDVKTMLDNTASDLEALRTIRDDIGRASADKKFEAVRDAIIKDRAMETEGCKVLIFTEYTSTAIDLHGKMKDAFADKTVSLIHGDVDPASRKKIIRCFAPLANLQDDDTLGEGEKKVDMLISTEVLSEGQNLQDCNYVINYDLPWNPMRIVQRTGRVDRLTSLHDTVHTRACFPDEQLDGLLKLVGNIMDKLDMVDTVVGTDIEILGKVPNPREFNGRLTIDIRALAGHDGDAGAVIRRLEGESDMMPTEPPFYEIKRHVDEISFQEMIKVPMGRRSGKSGDGQKAVLAYRSGRSEQVDFVVYDYATDTATKSDQMDALRLARCGRDEPTHLPMDHDGHQESFKELLRIDRKARRAIEDSDRGGERERAKVMNRPKPVDNDISKLELIIIEAGGDGRLEDSDMDDACRLLRLEQIRLWPDEVRTLLEMHNPSDSESPARLVSGVRDLAKRIHADDKSADDPGGKKEAAVGASALAQPTLIGALFIMGNNSPKPVRRGLDRHMKQ